MQASFTDFFAPYLDLAQNDLLRSRRVYISLGLAGRHTDLGLFSSAVIIRAYLRTHASFFLPSSGVCDVLGKAASANEGKRGCVASRPGNWSSVRREAREGEGNVADAQRHVAAARDRRGDPSSAASSVERRRLYGRPAGARGLMETAFASVRSPGREWVPCVSVFLPPGRSTAS